MGKRTVRALIGVLFGALLALGLEQALAAVWTDKLDYSPGEVVTISGDNRDNAGYLPGETVRVEVWGPNGYYATCEAVVQEDGSWSCQVTLWPDERAVGEYAYTARGLTSGVQESGIFWDIGNLDYAPASLTFNVSPGATISFTQVVTAPAGNDPFTATLKVTGLPSGWTATASPVALSFPGGNTPTAQSWVVTLQVPANATSGSYSMQVKADPQKVQIKQQTPGEGNGTSVTVNVLAPMNQPPTVIPPDDQTADEGTPSVFNLGTFSDDGPSPWMVTVDWGDASSETFEVSATGSLTWSHTYADDSVYTVTVTVTDKDGASGQAQFQVTVNNVPPVVGPLSVTPTDPIPVGTPITVTAVFTDPGILDQHTVVIYWDSEIYNPNVTTSPSITLFISMSQVVRSFTASYVYNQPGVYTLRVVVTDDDGGQGEALYQYVVVYDPSAGFVTGGGWIWSPQGACRLSWCTDETTGRANFGFVSKYQKGAKVPSGQTQFQFQAGNLNFHSTAYEWLVISGPKAQYKGTGTINGVPGYGFLLTAWDGQINGGGGYDKFRIKIWDLNTGDVVYDNQMGDSDSADPTTVIQGGSIVIHTK
ncbi:MAG: PKD domain-containing protein [Thermoflexus sp.]